MSTGAILSANLLNTSTAAYVSYSNPLPHTGPDVQAAGGMTVAAQDSAIINATIVLGATISGSTNAQAIARAVSLNDVSGGASAHVDSAGVLLTGGSLLVSAQEGATINANTTSEVSAASGNGGGTTSGQSYGSGTSLGASGTLGVNVVLGEATAALNGSTITTSDVAAGNVAVKAENSATLTANSVSAADVAPTSSSGSGTSGATTAASLTLALNTAGYDAENVLFQTLNALLGTPATSAFGTQSDAGAAATLLDTTVSATGLVSVDAINVSTVVATMSNTTTASTSGTSGGQSKSLDAVASLNEVSGDAQASITYSNSFIHATTPDISGGGGVAVTAQDSPTITSTITLGATSSTSSGGTGGTGTGGSSGATGVSGAVSLNDVQGGATATLSHATATASGGNVLVQAKETAILTASTTSEVSATQSSTGTGSSGGTSGTGSSGGTSLAVGGLIGTNLVQSGATATLSSSHVTTTGMGTGAGGVTVAAENTRHSDGDDGQRRDRDDDGRDRGYGRDGRQREHGAGRHPGLQHNRL